MNGHTVAENCAINNRKLAPRFSLDAAEKALKNTQLANQRTLLSLLNESQKQVVKDRVEPSDWASDINVRHNHRILTKT